MQTFAPEGVQIELGFTKLDYRRLGKQRVEALQIMNALVGVSTGWRNHPATIMWENHICALAHYGLMCCEEWVLRGYNDSLAGKFLLVRNVGLSYGDCPEPPKWLNDIRESHRSNLIRKDPEFYQHLWPNTPPDIPYVWPNQRENK